MGKKGEVNIGRWIGKAVQGLIVTGGVLLGRKAKKEKWFKKKKS
jgi:hypothetical protein